MMSQPLSPSEYPNHFFAGFWIRTFAYIVDLLIIGAIARILQVPAALLGATEWSLRFWHLTLGFSAIVFPIYFALFTKLCNGQTPGKMIFGLRVVCLIEPALSWKTVFVREVFARYIMKVFLFLYAIAAFTPKKQHLADLLADTTVVTLSHIETLEFMEKRMGNLDGNASANVPDRAV